MALRNATDQFIDTFKKLTRLQQVSLLAATVATFAAIVLLLVWANQPVYNTLYSDMPETDVEEVSAALDGKNIPYRIVDGASIEIADGEDVYATRAELALEGLPREAGVGFELFDESNLGMSEFQQNVSYQRALQGELARSISTMNGILEAKVHLFIPKDRIFLSEDEQSKASVVLRLAPSVVLSPEQVKAISHLVSSAVKGLEPDMVQIVDTAGEYLSKFLDENSDTAYITGTQLEQQRNIEQELEKKLQGLLSATLGYDKYVARVSVQMDFNARNIVREEFGDTPVLRSQHTLDITSTGRGETPEGIPGVEPNLAEPDLLIDGILSEYSRSEETQNYEISKTVTTEEKRSGEIQRLTVAVVVDDKLVPVDGEDGVRRLERQPRTDAEIERLRTAVAAAVGYNSDRGDIVDITNISFDTSSFGDDELLLAGGGVIGADGSVTGSGGFMGISGQVAAYAKYGVAILLFILFYFLMIRPILKRLDNTKEIEEEIIGETAVDAQLATLDIAVGNESGFPKTIEELEQEIESELEESVPVDVEAVKSKVMLKKIEEAAEDEPEVIANLVKALIKGG